MFPSNFDYRAPTSLNEAVSLLQGHDGDIKLLAGGQSLIPLLKLRLAQPAQLVDIGRVPELRGIHDEGSGIVVGATTTYAQVLDSALAQRRAPLLGQAIRQIGDPQVRARGTVGGSLAHADPSGDLPAVALALNAELRTLSQRGARSIPADQFFVDLLTTALESDAIVTSIRFEATDTPGMGTAYMKHRHPASGYAVVGVAAVVRVNDDGTCGDVRIGITGASTHAVRASATEQALAGRALDDAAIAGAANLATDGLNLLSDTYASDEFRAQLTRVLTRRAITEAARNARLHG